MTRLPAFRVDGPPDAPVLVLSNSLGTTMELWATQMAAFTDRFRVVRYEHRGHDGTVTEPGPYTIDQLGADALAVLDHLGEARASFAGVSLGGMVAMWVAANAPERVERLVLVCTSAQLGPAEPWHERAAAVRNQGTAFLVDGLLERWFTPGYVRSHPEIAELVTTMVGAVDAEGYAGCCEAIAQMDQLASLQHVTAPTLVIAGGEDPVCPPPLALQLQQAIHGSSFLVVPGAAHLAILEQPERVTNAMIDHLIGPLAQRGMQMRRAVLGDEHVDRAVAAITPFNAAFQDFITRFAWGDVWTRPGLDRRTRSCITLAMLVALGRFDELPMHLRGARRNGLTDEEIGEVLLQTAVYCGAPAANSAFAAACRFMVDEPTTTDEPRND